MGNSVSIVNPAPLTLIPAKVVTPTNVEIISVTDDGASVSVKISMNDVQDKSKTPVKHIASIVIWSGEDYINAGQWTDTDVSNRIKYMLAVKLV